MDYKYVSHLSIKSLFKELGTGLTGITDADATKRLSEYGLNRISSIEVTWWDILRRQFRSPFVYMLFAASALSFLLGEKVDSLMIIMFVILNTALGFYQEYKSEQTVKLLKKYLVKKIRVIRGGSVENIETENLVPGDILSFEPGDIIPADCRFIEDFNLMVDETVLTGESVQVAKTSSEITGEVNEIYDAGNIGFSGTTIVSGTAKAVVFATGSSTNYANIVKLVGETEKVSSFDTEITKFSKFTLWVVLATLIFIVVTSVAVKENPSITDLLLFSIALAVSVIPEALPVVTTFSLSIGAYNLTKKKVVVKRLTSVEDLGALQVLASDKTGTLTQNKLEVADVLSEDREATLFYAALASYFSDNARNEGNSAFDIAFRKSLSADQTKKLGDYKRLNEIPFDPGRKRITTIVNGKKGNYLISRGSPEEIIKLCKKDSANRIHAWIRDEGQKGRRTIGVAIRKLSGTDTKKDIFELESGMDFLGLISLSDPVKPSAYAAIVKAKKLGVKVKIVTGDSADVAGSVAKEIGLIENSGEVITGSDFEKLSIEKKHQAIDKYSVFARIVPEQKHEIITLIKERYYVGFLGEGINDAPALKASNVAVVVESGADVAKEAGDIVLLEKDLEVVMDGITEGRRVFANTTKYITATMASNFGNFFAVALIAPFINFLPMLPLQILLVNLLSDFPMIAVATDNVDEEVLETPKRYNLKGFAIAALSFGFISTAFDFIVFNTFYRHGEAQLQTYWFIESILSELLFLFTIRSFKPIYKASIPSKPLLVLTVVAIFVTFAIPLTAIGRKVFEFAVPELSHILWIVAIVVAYLLSNEIAKAKLFKYSNR